MKPDFKDKRGTITDLLVTPKYSVTRITFKKGAVRGNHYHKKTKQVDILVNGSLTCYWNDTKFRVKIGSIVNIPAGVRHAYKASRDSEIISICIGKRRGKNYEKDTYRLKENEKLI